MQTHTPVLIIGAAPTGLTLARELCLAGVEPIVIDRLPEVREVGRAGGLGGQILDVLKFRGLLGRLESASGLPRPTPRFPFGGLHVGFDALDESPMQAVRLPQPQLEELLAEFAVELGADVRRGHELVTLAQDDDGVTASVRGPEGDYVIRAQYAVGCDGVRSRVREQAGIAFPGTSYPEVNRLGNVTMPTEVVLRDDGDFDVAGIGRIPFGYSQTENGIFAIASPAPGQLGVYTSEQDAQSTDDEDRTPMTVTELRDSIRRVLGAELPLGEPVRLTRFTYAARQAEHYRAGRILLAGDAAHRFPAGGVAVNAGMLDAVNLGWKLAATVEGWAPIALLDSYHLERHQAGARTLLHTQAQVALRRGHDPASRALRQLFEELLADEQPLRRIANLFAEADVRHPMPGLRAHALAGTFAPDLELPGGTLSDLLHTGRPVVVVLARRPELADTARRWARRVDVHVAAVDDRPADAVLIRPDGCVAWAAERDEPAADAVAGLAEALAHWWGAAEPLAPATC